MKKLILLLNLIFAIHLAHCQTWSALSIQPNDGSQCLFTDTVNNYLYAGGQFTMVGSMPANHIARWDGTTWDTLGAGFNATVQCIAIYNNELYAGGDFTLSGSTPVAHIAKWDGTTWQQVGGGVDAQVFGLAVCNGDLYAGGFFTHAGGLSANRIAKWNGTSWDSCGSGTDASIWTLYSYNNEVYAGGFFTTAGGINCKRIAKYDGTNWSQLGAGFSSAVSSITTYQNKIYATGSFSSSGPTPLSAIAAWDGSQWSPLTTGLDAGGKRLCVYNNELYVTGSFTSAGTVTADGIARWNGFGWNAVGSCGGIKWAMSVFGGDLYVFGIILLNNPSNHLVKWNCPIAALPSAAFQASDTVMTVGSYVKFTNQSTGSSFTSTWSLPGATPSVSYQNNPIVNYPVAGDYDVMIIVATSAGSDTLLKPNYIHVDSLNHAVSYGISKDYVPFTYEHVTKTTVPGNITTEVDTCVYGLLEMYYYKPATYDSLNSPIIWGVHGLGGDGSSPIGDLITIADHRNAMIVSVSMVSNYFYDFIQYSSAQQPGSFYYSYFSWYPSIIKQLYQHVLKRENRNSIDVHLIGFSAGGQFVSRYMLIRQGVPDSIPIKMAVSTNPFSYTFCTDTFLNIPMYFPCGLLPGYTSYATNAPFECNEHVIQYYNENYGVLIGTGDTQPGFLFQADSVQGSSRYERAQNFYAFSDSNAVTRGTTLKWPYVEISGVGHNQTLMYNTKASPTDSSTIAETLLFDTPYHTVPSIAPVASFNADSTIININGTVNFINSSINASSFQWDFGDGNSSTLTNPNHVYTAYGTYSVSLIVNNLTSCENKTTKKCYITVTNAVAINEIISSDLNLKIYPNPVSDYLSIEVNSKTEKTLTLVLYNLLGVEQKQFSFHQSTQLNIKDFASGIYIYKIMEEDKMIGVGKIIKQ